MQFFRPSLFERVGPDGNLDKLRQRIAFVDYERDRGIVDDLDENLALVARVDHAGAKQEIAAALWLSEQHEIRANVEHQTGPHPRSRKRRNGDRLVGIDIHSSVGGVFARRRFNAWIEAGKA